MYMHKRVWYEITYRGWYAKKPNQTLLLTKFNLSFSCKIQVHKAHLLESTAIPFHWYPYKQQLNIDYNRHKQLIFTSHTNKQESNAHFSMAEGVLHKDK